MRPPHLRRALPLVLLAAVGALMGSMLIGLAGCTDVGSAQGPRPAATADTTTTADAPDAPATFRALTLDAIDPVDRATLEEVQALGVTHLALTTFGFQSSVGTPEIRMHTDGRWYSETDAGIRTLARQADTLGLEIILKPHIWIGDYHGTGQARSEIDFTTEAAWQRWEADYRRLILHYAHLAAEIDAALLVVGTELATAARTRPAFWRALIAEVRTVYDGPLTYAANWYDEYEHIPFWDALDYIGVQAYFELTDAPNPSLTTLTQSWRPHREAMARLARTANRPVLFTEIGYRSVPYAAARPWQWPSRSERGTAPDDTLQARLYDAFFESLWEQPWFAGAIIWKWRPDAPSRPDRHALNFSPQNKPAEQVLRRWYTGDTAPAATH
ncbi:MAG: hypothetical protein GVY18_02840 [Bacteroidetes bacterium]|jgi:hypothetical protein|nr:hypothetical protein [Bacteroidota bacterium]